MLSWTELVEVSLSPQAYSTSVHHQIISRNLHDPENLTLLPFFLFHKVPMFARRNAFDIAYALCLPSKYILKQRISFKALAKLVQVRSGRFFCRETKLLPRDENFFKLFQDCHTDSPMDFFETFLCGSYKIRYCISFNSSRLYAVLYS
ncbi:hypothetical protein GEMRC1_008688 [Eukaryota sp. GEM-RC1]